MEVILITLLSLCLLYGLALIGYTAYKIIKIPLMHLEQLRFNRRLNNMTEQEKRKHLKGLFGIIEMTGNADGRSIKKLRLKEL